MGSSRPRALILHANGAPGWKRIAADTALGAAGALLDSLPSAITSSATYRRLVAGSAQHHKSYAVDWLEAFLGDPGLDAVGCNILDLSAYGRALRTIRDYDLIVLLHSTTSTNFALLRERASRFRERRGKLVTFFGNEFHQMPQKIGFARAIGVDYVASQLTLSASRWLYEPVGCGVLSVPHALNVATYQRGPIDRPIDIGFRGDQYDSKLLGDRLREEMLERFRDGSERWGLRVRIEIGRTFREEWADFLRSCHGTVGAEAGTYYLERDDATRRAATEYLRDHPDATYDEVFEQVFRPVQAPVSGKTISSRHLEAVGTETCQVLVDGDYAGVLRADEHYIAVRKDFSNLDAAVRRFKDEGERRRIATAAREHVLAHHTHAHRVHDLVRAVLA